VQKTIYVGNLEWNTSPEELKLFFSPIGTVTSAEIIKDRETGKSKGFGFVTMENAEQAMIEMNGKELRGRSLKINEAREKTPRSTFRETTPPRYDERRY
jgi:RNA recognition motif-containing protein